MGGIQGQNKDETLKCILYITCFLSLFITRTFGTVMRAAKGQAFFQRRHPKTKVKQTCLGTMQISTARCKGPSLLAKTTPENEGEAKSAENISQRHTAKWLHTRDNAKKTCTGNARLETKKLLARNSADIISQRHTANRLHTRRQQPKTTPKNWHHQSQSDG